MFGCLRLFQTPVDFETSSWKKRLKACYINAKIGCHIITGESAAAMTHFNYSYTSLCVELCPRAIHLNLDTLSVIDLFRKNNFPLSDIPFLVIKTHANLK
jgi:hypothetical protein